MKTRIHKWGNSLALRIPRSFARETEIEDNSLVNLSLKNHNLIISPVREGEDLSLSALLSDIKEDNLHEPVEFGEPVGRELL